jgi:Myb-like DNA-binding domain
MEEEDLIVKDQFVRKIFAKGENDKAPPDLRTIGELREAFSDKPFNFDRFNDRIDILMGEWCSEFFNEPRLAPFYFPDNLDAPSQHPIELLSNLRKRRRSLRNTGEDPLKDSLRLAELATGKVPAPRDPPDSRRASSIYKRKNSATQLQFEDDEEVESDDPNGDGTHQLTNLPVRGAVEAERNTDEDSPRRKKGRKSQQKKYEGKRTWSDDEKNAIIEGLRTHGKGSWASIKEEYDVLFSMRTSGQIKDCFRRMYQKGEIPKDLMAEWEKDEKRNTTAK